MSIVTTYVCDVSGKNGTNREDFVDVQISANGHYRTSPTTTTGYTPLRINKLVHKDIAIKLNLYSAPPDTPVPEVTFEGKLKALLTEYVDSIVADSVAETVYQAMQNR